MIKWFVRGAVVLCLIAAAPAARADLIVEGSLGKGVKLGPSPVKAEPTNIMIAPGLTFFILRAELGLVWDVPDIQPHKSNLELRPMLVVAPPVLPLYGRVVFAVTNLIDGPRQVAWG